jgi:hypothetical protein
MEMFAFERRWARVIGRVLVPPGILGGVVDDVDLGERWADECRRSRWDGALLLRFSLWLTWFAPLWMFRAFHFFGGCDAPTQLDVLEKLLKSKRYLIRMAGMFLKLSATTLLLGDERALKQMGAYDYGRGEVLPLRARR